MIKSESINELASALAKFHNDVGPVKMDSNVEVTLKSGGNYKFKYASLAAAMEVVKKPLSVNGLSITQLLGSGGIVTTILMHSSGQYIGDTFLIETSERNPQAIGSAVSYAKRYSFFAIIGIIGEEDDDANIAEGNQYKAVEKKQSENELPWMTQKVYDAACLKIQKAKPLVNIKDGDNDIELSMEDFVKRLHSQFRMKKEYSEGLNREIEFQLNFLTGNDGKNN